MALVVSRFPTFDARALTKQGTLRADPGAGLSQGLHTLDTLPGGFDITLRAATGSQARYIFIADTTVSPTQPVVLRVPDNEALNSITNSTYVFTTPHEVVTVTDQSAGNHTLHVQGRASNAGKRLVSVPTSDVTHVGGVGSFISSGSPGVNETLVTACHYFDQGTRRYITVEMQSDQDDAFEVDVGPNALPTGAHLESVWAQLVDFTGDVGVPSPAITTVGSRQFRLDRVNAIDGVITLRVQLVAQNVGAPGQRILERLHAPVAVLSGAAFGLSADFSAATVPDDISTWVLVQARSGNQLSTNGTVLSGFVAGEPYLVSYGIHAAAATTIFHARDALTGDVVPGSAVFPHPTSDSSAEGSLSTTTFLYLPSTTHGLVIGPTGATAQAVASGTYCTVRQLPRSWAAAHQSQGWAFRGTLTATWPQPSTPEGVYGVDTSAGPFDLVLPRATGSQAVYVLTAVDVTTNNCVVRVASGDALDDRVDGTCMVKQGTIVMIIDAAPGEYATRISNMAVFDVTGASANDFARYSASRKVFEPVSLTGRAVQYLETVVPSSDVALSAGATTVMASTSRTDQDGDAAYFEGVVTVNVTGSGTGTISAGTNVMAISNPGVYSVSFANFSTTTPVNITVACSLTSTLVAAQSYLQITGWRNL